MQENRYEIVHESDEAKMWGRQVKSELNQSAKKRFLTMNVKALTMATNTKTSNKPIGGTSRLGNVTIFSKKVRSGTFFSKKLSAGTIFSIQRSGCINSK